MIITGHSSGIGKFIFDAYSSAKGLSRTNGYNIEHTNEILEIIKKEKPKVFINNAYSRISQSNILLGIFENNFDCRVINIGSISAFRTDAKSKEQIQYSSDKKHLKQTHDHVRRNGLNSVLIELGPVDTEYNKFKTIKKLSLSSVLNIVNLCISEENIDTIRWVP